MWPRTPPQPSRLKVVKQKTEERERLEAGCCKLRLAALRLQRERTVSGPTLTQSTYFIEDFAKNLAGVRVHIVKAECSGSQHARVEICSDSGLVAMNVYLFEIHSCLVARQEYLAKEDALGWSQVHLRRKLLTRAALQVKTYELL